MSDLGLDSMTLILKLDLNMVKMYHHTKNEVSMSRHSKVIALTDRQTGRHTHTHTQYENITFPHTWVVIKGDETHFRYYQRFKRSQMIVCNSQQRKTKVQE